MRQNSLKALMLLLLCLVLSIRPSIAAQDKILAIHGKAVTDDGIKDGFLIVKNGIITAIGANASDIPPGATTINWTGYIFPGLIDTHNHADWNWIPQWTHGPFTNRYDWQKDSDYVLNVQKPHDAIKENNLIQEARKYGEIRAILGGTTLIAGSFDKSEPNIMVRDLDARYKAENYVPNIAEMVPEKRDTLIRQLQNKASADGLQRVFFHVGEGLPTDKAVAGEFEELRKKGFDQEGVVVIHGLAFKPEYFETMAKKKMYLVWSPVSNWNLYRGVTNIPAAKKAGVTIALAPDWTISGSDNVLEEMKFAYALSKSKWGDLLSPKDIFDMVTTNAATVAGVDKSSITYGAPMGSLAKDNAADLFLAPALDVSKNDPYESLLRTYPKDIHLVLVGGNAVYGDRGIMSQLAADADDLSVQNVDKAIVTVGESPSNLTDKQHLKVIRRNLESVAPHLAPLIEN